MVQIFWCKGVVSKAYILFRNFLPIFAEKTDTHEGIHLYLYIKKGIKPGILILFIYLFFFLGGAYWIVDLDFGVF